MPMTGQSSHSTPFRWLVGTVLVPIILSVIGIVGVKLTDFLFPTPAPSIEFLDTGQLNRNVLKLESQVALLVDLLRDDMKGTQEKGSPISASPATNKGLPQSTAATKPANIVETKRQLEVKNSSKLLGRKLYVGRRTWEWTIYIKADNTVLDQIDCVTYTLHPTFPNPIRKVCVKGMVDHAFSYTTRGWGTFMVKVLIQFKDKSEVRKQHQLVFTERQ